MHKKAKGSVVILGLLVLSGVLFAQDGPVPIVTPSLIDTSVYNGVYRGVQSQIFCEPTTGNLVAAWYRYYGSDPDPRRITAATSTDDGATWIIHENINYGVGTEMNARYATVSGISTTPIIAYSDRNPTGTYQEARPIVATDLVGWGGDVFDNVYVDNSDVVDTVLYNRYLSVAVAGDNSNLWAVGSYHNADPGEALYYYYSEDGGVTWNGPQIPASAVAADSDNANYVIDLSSSGLGVGLGNNNEVMVSGLGQWYSDDDLWRLLYATSDDKGETWSPISIIPGAETLEFANGDFYRQFTSPLLDNAGNWHIFAVGIDTTEDEGFPQPYRAWDFRYNGSTWSINKFVFPQLLDNGIIAWGDWPADVETYPMNEPAIGPDGTLYYAYTDVVDTSEADTGAGLDESLFNYNIMVMVSEDNGDTWKGPVSVLDNWDGRSPNGMARFATDKLHIAYRRHFYDETPDEFYYMGVPTDTIKALAEAGIEETSFMPTEFALHQNYPNPFNPVTTIRFDLKENSHITLTIFNTLGQKVATVVDEDMTAGYKGVVWDASDKPSGTYFYRLKVGDFSKTRKMVLVK